MSISDPDRRRIGILLLFGGTMLVLLAAAAYISYEQKRLPPPATQLSPERKAELRARVRTPLRILLLGSGLTLGFVAAVYVFLAWSRSYRSGLTRPPSRPTPVEDVWSMHRLPEGALDDMDEPESPGEQDHEPRNK